MVNKTNKASLIVGRLPLVEAMESGKQIDKILLSRSASGEHIGDIRRLAKQQAVPIQMVVTEKLNSITKTNHQGVIAFAAVVQYLDLQDIIDFINQQGQTPLMLMLDGITDIRNIGAIARTAHCMGVQAIIIPDKGMGMLNEDAMKSSAGALNKIHICRVNSLMKAVDTLHLNGIMVFGAEMKAQKIVSQISYQQPCCIIMGGEEKGIYPALQKICDDLFYIPMPSNFESLNVGAATAMILYEAAMQRANHK